MPERTQIAYPEPAMAAEVLGALAIAHLCSIELDVEFFDECSPFLALGHHKITEGLAVGRDGIGDHRCHALLDHRLLRQRLRARFDLCDDVLWHAGAHADPKP